MKNKLSSIALLFLANGAAHAASQVTLYGIIDDSVIASTNSGGKHQYAMSAGGLSGNRWGLTGIEDLGDGYSALFRLENGFDTNTGTLNQGGREFGRQAWVGLASPYGTIIAGRQLNPDVDMMSKFEFADVGGHFTAHPADLDNLNGSFRTNNALKFLSKDYAGFKFEALYSLGGVAGNVTQNQVWGLGGTYDQGPLQLGVTYTNARSANLSLVGASASVSSPLTAATNVYTSPVNSGLASAHGYESYAAGAAYKFGNSRLSAVYTNIRYEQLGDVGAGPNPYGYGGSAIFNDAEINYRYMMTPFWMIGAEYNFLMRSSINSSTGSIGNARYHQFTLGTDYQLSKRTDAYVMATYQQASGTDSKKQTAVASINGLTASSNSRQGLLMVGIRHRF
jgi:predicted porin